MQRPLPPVPGQLAGAVDKVELVEQREVPVGARQEVLQHAGPGQGEHLLRKLGHIIARRVVTKKVSKRC